MNEPIKVNEFKEMEDEMNAVLEIDICLEKLKDSNRLLRNFATFGAGFLAARIAIAVKHLVFSPDKEKSSSSCSSSSSSSSSW